MKQTIERILGELCPGVDLESETLIDEGLIDSFDLVSLVGELMDEFDVELTVEDLLPENFNSVDAIVELIARKR
ncbi:MAG: acyl carrier protein [Oscillospiraceae bacterium]|nr:acyl carrier protein [Oscillospiraceae bacterium]